MLVREVLVDKILIVDDLPISQEVLNELLSPYYELIFANNGQEGYDLTKSKKPDLIIMDVVMPVLNGFEATKLIKADEEVKDIPIIFITVLDNIQDVVKGFEIGGVDYIIKPFHDLEVLSRINTQIKLRKYQAQILELTKKNSILAMAVTVNHDIRQPLTVLQGYLDKMIDDLQNFKIVYNQKSIDRINISIETIVKFLNKYCECENYDIDNYISDNFNLSNIPMVKFREGEDNGIKK